MVVGATQLGRKGGRVVALSAWGNEGAWPKGICLPGSESQMMSRFQVQTCLCVGQLPPSVTVVASLNPLDRRQPPAPMHEGPLSLLLN